MGLVKQTSASLLTAECPVAIAKASQDQVTLISDG
jgi:hypothetical protein